MMTFLIILKYHLRRTSGTLHDQGMLQDHGVGSNAVTGSVLMIIFQDRQSINGNVNETSNELQ